MREHIAHIHRRLKHHHGKLREHVAKVLGGRKIPTEYVEDDELAFAPSHPKVPVLSRVKLVRFRKPEDFDNVRTFLKKYDMILINVSSFQNVDELKRGIGRIQLLPARGIKCKVSGLDSHWIVVTSGNIEHG